jgi:hypothetical protein
MLNRILPFVLVLALGHHGAPTWPIGETKADPRQPRPRLRIHNRSKHRWRAREGKCHRRRVRTTRAMKARRP